MYSRFIKISQLWQNYPKHLIYFGELCCVLLLAKLSMVFLKKMGQPQPLFRLISVFSNKQYNFYNKSM